MPARWFVPILVLSLAALSLTWPTQDGPERPPERLVVDSAAREVVGPGDLPDPLLAAGLAVDAYWASEYERQLAEAEAARLREVEEAAARKAVNSGTVVRGTVGECTGFVIPDYIILRESGGNPSAYNPSGAYGCAQTLLSHYSGGTCDGLDPYTIDGQRECVWRLSNGGTNLGPWAATR